MNFNPVELLNVTTVLLLFSVLIYKRDVPSVLFILFAYGSFHYAFSVLYFFVPDSENVIDQLHVEGGGVLAKVSILSILLITLIVLSKHAFSAYLKTSRQVKKLPIMLLSVMVLLLCGYLFNIRSGDWQQLKNVVSIESLLFILLIGFLGIDKKNTVSGQMIYIWAIGAICALAVSDCIAVFEIFDHHVWSRYLDSSGVMVYRASSFLFNPNLYAFWASVLYLLFSYALHICYAKRGLMIFGLVLASCAIYFTGARSVAYLLWLITLISAVFIKNQKGWVPVFVMPATLVLLYSFATWCVSIVANHSDDWQDMVSLGERFLSAPISLFNYVLRPAEVSRNVIISIEGRFAGGERDSGWIVLYQDAGWIGLAALLAMAGMFALLGWRAYRVRQDAASVYALAVLAFTMLIGLVLRFQVFPVWLLIGVILIPCMEFWRRLQPAQHQGGN